MGKLCNGLAGEMLLHLRLLQTRHNSIALSCQARILGGVIGWRRGRSRDELLVGLLLVAYSRRRKKLTHTGPCSRVQMFFETNFETHNACWVAMCGWHFGIPVEL